jgi:predicted metal-dependent peptidase
MSDSISQAIIRLFEQEMFYAEIITQMRRKIDYNLKASAGVCIKDRIELHINPKGWYDEAGEFFYFGFDYQSLQERVDTLRHECGHILQDHIPRIKEVAPELFEKNQDIADIIVNKKRFEVFNIAADCAVNYGIPGLNKGWNMYPNRFDLQDGETFEWYLEKLKNNKSVQNMTGIDNHDLWKESSNEDKDTLKEKIRQAVNKAAERTRAAGRMTSQNELLVQGLNQASVNWKEQIKRFVARSLEIKTEDSRKKRNRRYGIMYPGQVKIEELHIGVAIDTSGSMSDKSLQQIVIGELQLLAKYAKVTVVEADNEIKNIYTFKPGEQYALAGRGGTAYQPAFDYFNTVKDIDAVIYFGDMDSSDTPEKPKFPVLWAVVGNQDPPADFGSKIEVKVS